MRLFNNGDEFTVVFDYTEYFIPKGEFDVNSDELGFFIKKKAQKWGKDIVVMAGTPKPAVKKVEAIVLAEEAADEVDETPKKKVSAGKSALKDAESEL